MDTAAILYRNPSNGIKKIEEIVAKFAKFGLANVNRRLNYSYKFKGTHKHEKLDSMMQT